MPPRPITGLARSRNRVPARRWGPLPHAPDPPRLRFRWPTAVLLALSLSALATGGVHAAWRDDHAVLRVGFLTTAGVGYDALRLEPFRAYLESWLPLPVELVALASYAALVDAQVTDRVQYAIHSATSYVTAAEACDCVEPLALPAAFDGARGFHAILVTRADGAIATLADAEGARLAVAGEDSVAGRLVPMKLLAREGIDPEVYFSTIVETAGPEAAVTALFTGVADVAAAWSSPTGQNFGVLAAMVGDGVLGTGQVRSVWASPLIPFGPHAVRSDVPEELKVQLAAALTQMATASPEALDAVDRSTIGGGGFVAVADGDYAVIEALMAPPAPPEPTAPAEPAEPAGPAAPDAPAAEEGSAFSPRPD